MAENDDLSAKDSGTLPPLRMTTIGYNGLDIHSGVVMEECDPELRWPRCQYTYKKMLKDATIAPAVDYVQTLISRVPWHINPAEGEEEWKLEDAKMVESIKGDMEHSMLSFVKQAVSFVALGFAAFEIVPRTRLKSKGSKYNDGLRGIRKLSLRSQDTIIAADYINDGRDFNGLWQRVKKTTRRGKYKYAEIGNNVLKPEVFIPKDRLLLFRNNPVKDNPFGNSPLNSVFEAFKYKKAYETNEGHSVASDIQGLKVLELPPQYLLEDATEEDKATLEMFKVILRNMHMGKESCITIPNISDEHGNPQFKFSVINNTGQKAHDVGKIIERYKQEILTALYASFLVTGQGGGGSFALSESLMKMVVMVIESKLEEIRDVLNHHLIPLIFKWNGWEREVYPTFEFGEVELPDFDEFSKVFQRLGAVKLIPRTPENLNWMAKKLRMPYRFKGKVSQEEMDKILGVPPAETGAAEGMEDGMNNGTGSSSGGSGDSSAGNKENA